MNENMNFLDDVCDVDREAREILAEIRELEGDKYE